MKNEGIQIDKPKTMTRNNQQHRAQSTERLKEQCLSQVHNRSQSHYQSGNKAAAPPEPRQRGSLFLSPDTHLLPSSLSPAGTQELAFLLLKTLHQSKLKLQRRQNVDQVSSSSVLAPPIASSTMTQERTRQNSRADHASLYRVRTLTGKEIELDIEPGYKVRLPVTFLFTILAPITLLCHHLNR